MLMPVMKYVQNYTLRNNQTIQRKINQYTSWNIYMIIAHYIIQNHYNINNIYVS